MEIILILILAITLSFDTFAASINYGILKPEIKFKQAIPIAIVFAIFQAAFFGFGYLSGTFISHIIMGYSVYLSSSILIFLGVRMIIKVVRETILNIKKEAKKLSLILLSIATSIDAFAVGVSFGLLYDNFLLASIIIGIVTFVFSMASIRVGKFFGDNMERTAEIVGGIILILLGIKNLIIP